MACGSNEEMTNSSGVGGSCKMHQNWLTTAGMCEPNKSRTPTGVRGGGIHASKCIETCVPMLVCANNAGCVCVYEGKGANWVYMFFTPLRHCNTRQSSVDSWRGVLIRRNLIQHRVDPTRTWASLQHPSIIRRLMARRADPQVDSTRT